MIAVDTIGGSLDEPFIHISCQFAYEIDIEYCGYDGIADENNPDDPDRGYFGDDPGDGPDGEPFDEDTDPGPEDDDWQKSWSALSGWIHDVLGAGQDTSEPGTSVCLPLSDGRYLYLYSANSPVVISLSEYGPDSGEW